MRWLLVLLVACGDAVTGEDVYLEHPGELVKINIAACHHQYIWAYLPLGSMWIEVDPISQYACSVTLGGETENPSYDGGASQRCVFARFGTLTIDVPTGGPPYLDKPSCADL